MSTTSEIVDSGKFTVGKSSEKSNFSQTCNLLSQYIKEKGTLGDLSLGAKNGNPEMYRQSAPVPAATTMNLFPVNEKQPKSTVFTAPMTIFYGGQVIVLNNIPVEKAKEIMSFASSHSSQKSAATYPITADLRLPIARNASLTRFLEKRKDRIIARAPYHVKKPEESKSWLRLAALSAMQS